MENCSRPFDDKLLFCMEKFFLYGGTCKHISSLLQPEVAHPKMGLLRARHVRRASFPAGSI